jgi:tetratricopeptide (TPR) repeat protein
VTTRPNDWDDEEIETFASLEDELADLRERHRRDPPLDLLRAAGADALPDPLQEKVAAYLHSSDWNRALVEGADAADPTLDAAWADRLLTGIRKRPLDEGATARRARWVWAPALALAAVAIAALVGVVWRDAARPIEAPATAGREASPATTQQPTQPPRQTFKLELAKPDVKLTATALILRGEGKTGRFVDEAAPGLNAYRAGDYEKAAREFEALQPRYPKSVEIMFYLGISRLFLEDAPAAARALESARDLNDESFNGDAEWYLAVAYERAGDRDRSRARLEGLCRGNGAFAARACAAVSSFR